MRSCLLLYTAETTDAPPFENGAPGSLKQQFRAPDLELNHLSAQGSRTQRKQNSSSTPAAKARLVLVPLQDEFPSDQMISIDCSLISPDGLRFGILNASPPHIDCSFKTGLSTTAR